MKTRRKKLIVPIILLLFVLLIPTSVGAVTESAGGTIEYGTREIDVVTITIAKEYIDLYDEAFDGELSVLFEVIEADADFLDDFSADKFEDYGYTDEGDFYYVMTEKVYQEFWDKLIDAVISSIQMAMEEFEIEDPFTIHRDSNLTTIQIEMTKEDYQIIVSENRKLLYAARAVADLYHALMGTSDDSVIIQFLDSDTGEVLDDADWYDWFGELTEIKTEESSETESEAAE